MADITLKGNPCHTSGDLPAVGSQLPDFKLVAADLSEKSLADFSGKKLIISIFPSLDTSVCAVSVQAFNQKAAGLDGAHVINVSKDLPFAQKRFCESHNIDQVTTLSAFRDSDFGQKYGMDIVDGPLQGLLGRAILVVDADGKVVYSELVPEIAQEPNYDAALAAL